MRIGNDKLMLQLAAEDAMRLIAVTVFAFPLLCGCGRQSGDRFPDVEFEQAPTCTAFQDGNQLDYALTAEPYQGLPFARAESTCQSIGLALPNAEHYRYAEETGFANGKGSPEPEWFTEPSGTGYYSPAERTVTFAQNKDDSHSFRCLCYDQSTY